MCGESVGSMPLRFFLKNFLEAWMLDCVSLNKTGEGKNP